MCIRDRDIRADPGFLQLPVILHRGRGYIHIHPPDGTIFMLNAVYGPDTLQNIFYGIVLRVLARFDGKPFMPHILKGSHLPPDLLLSQLLSGNMAVLLMIRAVDTSVDAIIGQI